jgi:putative CocE/NonD family hydrolase
VKTPPLGCAVLLALVIAFAVLALFAQTPPPAASPSPKESPPATADYDLHWGVKIPMRDKVELNATLYLPKTKDESSSKTPVIFTLTPYISDTYHARAAYFASHGYAFALIDVRGRGNSGGEFEPFAQEPRDGHDVVEWLAQQLFCDGKVAMWGGSYAGFDQWATAKEFPPHLATIVPAAAAHPPLDYPSLDNVGETYDVQWFTLTSGRAAQNNLFGDQKFWRTKFLDAYKNHSPFKSLDSFVGNPSVNFQRILKHPMADAYYDTMVPTREQFQKITLPILTITGQYDGDELGALTFYRDHLANASPEVRAKHFLVIGPWDHAGTRTPTDEVGGVKFGSASVLDLNDLHRQW